MQIDERLPITTSLLNLIYAKAPTALSAHYDICLIRAIAMVAFHGFFRLGELIQKQPGRAVQVGVYL